MTTLLIVSESHPKVLREIYSWFLSKNLVPVDPCPLKLHHWFHANVHSAIHDFYHFSPHFCRLREIYKTTFFHLNWTKAWRQIVMLNSITLLHIKVVSTYVNAIFWNKSFIPQSLQKIFISNNLHFFIYRKRKCTRSNPSQCPA